MTTGAASEQAPALLIEAHERIATLTLNRPAALNALNGELKDELLAAFRRLDRDAGVRAVVITGAGRAFCAGQDLRETSVSGGPALAAEIVARYNPLIRAMRQLEKPIVASVNGVAAGAGMGLAMAADLRIAAEGASFALAFGRIGLVPDSGLSWILPRLVGPAKAAELIMLGDPIPATEALRMGLVNRVVPDADLAQATNELARRLAAAAPRAIGLAKRALNRSLEVGLEEALAYEAALQGIAGATADHREGVAAFREKRDPHFTGE